MGSRNLFLGFLALLAVLVATSGSFAASPQYFNGNRYSDLAIGVPFENVSGATDAGSVSVLYGRVTGLSATADEYWQQNYLDGSNAEPQDNFGMALAVGDFNADGFFDLAVSSPNEDVGSTDGAGAVHVIYGSASGGLDVAGNQYWNQDEPGMAGGAETGDHFGAALAAGDFNGDGYDDLAVGIPDEDIGSVVDVGGMMVLYGSAGALRAARKVWNQETGAEVGDQFGQSLAAGDFNGDGYDDLAVGVPSEDLVSVQNTGAVQIYYGSSGGIRVRVQNDFWHQDRSGVAGAADEHDYFGAALTSGDFDGDGYDDLAVGVPYEDIGSPSIVDAGAVNVLYGSGAGITAAGSDFWHQESAGVGSIAEEDDRFGFALTAGDFDGDRRDDLAIGLPFEDWNDQDTGIVQVLYGANGGLRSAGDQLWRQDVTDIAGSEEAHDRFGYAVAAGDFDGDTFADLAIGVPYEAIGSTQQAGAVNVIYGSRRGLTAAGNQIWYQGNNGVQGAAETGDRFGYALAASPRENRTLFLPLLRKH